MSKTKSIIGKYNPSEIEQKWQDVWEKDKIYSPNLETAKNPFYNLMMFPYPSAEGMHVGNMYAFTGADVYGRFQRMQGKDVFEPIGLDGFGIHSENYAIKAGKHPVEQAKISEKNFYRQLRSIGNGFDWTRTVETYKPEFYKWTQWLFIQLFKAGLAYRKKAPVNFCPSCKTVLSDEQVVAKLKVQSSKLKTTAQNLKLSENQRLDQRESVKEAIDEATVNVCERCETKIEKRNLEQWFFKITKYADRLLNGLTQIDWSEKVKTAQKLWIGRSDGARIEFEIQNSKFKIEVFTTRPDTLFGATFIVLSPEHPLIAALLEKQFSFARSHLAKLEGIREYVQKAKKKSEQERMTEGKEKTGVFTGLYAINPINNEKIPVWIADYVLMNYGTGAIMAVPAHDSRDFEFAKKYELPIKQVISSVSTVVFIHGAPKGPEDNMDLGENSKEKYWMLSSREELKKLGYKVYIPIMPTPWMPKYEEWKKEFEKHPVDEDSVVVATSCGGSFIVRWLSETKRKIGKLILVAPAKEAAEGKELRLEALRRFYDYEIDSNVRNYVREAIIMTSNDEERHLRSADLFEKAFNAKRIKKEGKQHFVLEELPEIVDLIVGLDHAHEREGEIINSGEWNGWETPDSIGKVIDWLEKKGLGKKEANYHLRDWLISRQRYWGPPIPMIYCEKCDWQPVPEDQLPVELPFIQDYKPLGTGVAPLASHPEFYKTTCPKCGGEARRETDVSDTFLDSSWYFLRYVSTDIETNAFDRERVKKWLPVNMYIGGAEHSVLHLLYSRFITMALHDLGHFSFEEPFTQFRAHGLIVKDGAKMSKSKGNVVIPDAYIKKFGADTLRAYLMFSGPFSQGGDFRDSGIEGMNRFLRRVWALLGKSQISNLKSQISNESLRMMHKTIRKVTEDIENLSYNTAIAGLMEYYNFLSDQKSISQEEVEVFLKLLAPFAPHMTEELFQMINDKGLMIKDLKSIHRETWPAYDEKYLVEDERIIAVQVNGKLRDAIKVKSEKLKVQSYVEQLVRQSAKVKKYLDGKKILKVIYIEGKIVNFVV